MAVKTRAVRRRVRPIPADSMRLVREFPLRLLRSEAEYEQATAILDRLAVQPEGSLTRGEQDYMEVLTLLVQAYDDERFRIETAHLSPLDMLKYLMEQSGMRSADLARLLGGNRALTSLILNGHRALSKTHIRLLADYFKVEPSLFMAE